VIGQQEDRQHPERGEAQRDQPRAGEGAPRREDGSVSRAEHPLARPRRRIDIDPGGKPKRDLA
jgi:hypothetical protein